MGPMDHGDPVGVRTTVPMWHAIGRLETHGTCAPSHALFVKWGAGVGTTPPRPKLSGPREGARRLQPILNRVDAYGERLETDRRKLSLFRCRRSPRSGAVSCQTGRRYIITVELPATDLNKERRHQWFVRTGLTWLVVSALGGFFAFRHPWAVGVLEFFWTLISLVVWIVGDSRMAPKLARPAKSAGVGVSVILPRGFVPHTNEDVFFSYATRCALPRSQTRTFGGFVGPVMATESDSRVVTGLRRNGSLTITSDRVVVYAGSEVREWPTASITSVYAASAHKLVMRVANVGAAEFSWTARIASQAEHAVKRACHRLTSMT